jgi:hypothetical protein
VVGLPARPRIGHTAPFYRNASGDVADIDDMAMTAFSILARRAERKLVAALAAQCLIGGREPERLTAITAGFATPSAANARR